jgi:hypothetical protein
MPASYPKRRRCPKNPEDFVTEALNGGRLRGHGWLAVGLASLTCSAGAHASGALAAIAPEVARGLGTVPESAIVVAAQLASDLPAPKGDDLAVKLAAVIAGKLGGTAHAHGQAAPLSVARAVAGKGGALVYVQAEIARGELRVTADLYPVMSNAWDRVRVPAPPPRAHAFAHAPLDAEVRTYLPAIALEQAHLDKAKHDQGDVLAAACGDLDGDGGNELVLVSRASVAWGHLRGGKFVAEHAVAWSALAPRAPVLMREPLATAIIVPRKGELGGDLFVGMTDRGAFAVSRDLLAQSPLLGMPVAIPNALGCVRSNPALGAFEGAAVDCTVDDKKALLDLPLPRYDAVASYELVGKDGSARGVYGAREPGGKLRLRLGDAVHTLDGVGAQVALGDLDEDGVPEVITTADTGDDAVEVSTWRGAELRPRVRYPAPAGVRALCVCPPEQRGVPALVAVVGGEVWVAR